MNSSSVRLYVQAVLSACLYMYIHATPRLLDTPHS